MARIQTDRVSEFSTTEGLLDMELAGAVTGYRTFSEVMSDADTCYYKIEGGGAWEIGVGTYDADLNVLERTTLIESSDGSGLHCAFGAGTKTVQLIVPVQRTTTRGGALTSTRIPFADSNGELTDDSRLTFTVSSGTFSNKLSGSLTPSATTAAVFVGSTASTTNSSTVMEIGINSTGTAGAGFGCQIDLRLETSTTDDILAGRFLWEWVVATHASRTSRLRLYATDATDNRECMRIESSGTAAMVGFLGASAAARQASTTDLKDLLVTFGFLTDSGATPLNLDAGALTAGAGTFSAVVQATVTDAVTNTSETAVVSLYRESTGTPAAGFGGNIEFRAESSTTTGRLVGRIDYEWETATDASRVGRLLILPADSGGSVEAFRCETDGSTAAQISFYGVAAVSQHTGTGETTGHTGGAGAAVRVDSTFTGNTGTKAYTVSDIVKALKNVGIMAAS